MPQYEAHCPTCGTLIESYEMEGGWTATAPGVGTRVGTGEAPSELGGMLPNITANPDFDVMTVDPCGHVLHGAQIRELRFRIHRDIPEPLDLTKNGDGLKASPSEAEAGGAFLVIDDSPSGTAAALSREEVVKLRDWLTKLLEETA
jgi:hypothetical protein